jgi:hypothetical protein
MIQVTEFFQKFFLAMQCLPVGSTGSPRQIGELAGICLLGAWPGLPRDA